MSGVEHKQYVLSMKEEKLKTIMESRPCYKQEEEKQSEEEEKQSLKEKRRMIVNNIKESYQKQFKEELKHIETQFQNKGNRFDYNGAMNKLVKKYQNKLDKLKNEKGMYYED